MAALRDAQGKGLQAAARVTQNAVKRSLRHGYHSSLGNWGDFTTGNNLNHVTISPVKWETDGLSIKVGTDLMYALFWEVGHHNIFTRHFERDEKWAPAYRESRAAALDAYMRVFSRNWGARADAGAAASGSQGISPYLDVDWGGA
jgi:hypothetical protein